MTGGARAEINLGRLMLKRQQVIGSTLRARSDAEKAEITSAFQSRFGDAVAAGRIGVVVETVLPLESAPDAHRMVEASTHFGKVILRVSGD